MKIQTDKKKIESLINSRFIEKIYPSKEVVQKMLASGRRLRVYLGVDATGPHLHLGHATNLLLMRQFQELGHEFIFLIGDFTAQIGDPSDKSSARQPLTETQVKENFATFKKQAAHVIQFSGENPARVAFNSTWLKKMNFADLVKLASHITVQQMITRDMFQKRLSFTFECPHCGKEQILSSNHLSETGEKFISNKTGKDLTQSIICKNCGKSVAFEERNKINSPKPIGLHEFFYPLMQGYDSVAMDVDGEIGGNDQTFNMLVGRDLMWALKQKEKFVMTTRLLINPKTGVKLMNKSEGGMINLDDEPGNMFGKIMAVDDAGITPLAEFCTLLPNEKINALKDALQKEKTNPRDIKMDVAYEIVSLYHSPLAAEKAKENWLKIFSKKEDPEDLEIREVSKTALNSGTMAVLTELETKSKSEWRRLLSQGAIKVNGKTVDDPDEKRRNGDVIKIGKKKFFRVK